MNEWSFLKLELFSVVNFYLNSLPALSVTVSYLLLGVVTINLILIVNF